MLLSVIYIFTKLLTTAVEQSFQQALNNNNLPLKSGVKYLETTHICSFSETTIFGYLLNNLTPTWRDSANSCRIGINQLHYHWDNFYGFCKELQTETTVQHYTYEIVQSKNIMVYLRINKSKTRLYNADFTAWNVYATDFEVSKETDFWLAWRSSITD